MQPFPIGEAVAEWSVMEIVDVWPRVQVSPKHEIFFFRLSLSGLKSPVLPVHHSLRLRTNGASRGGLLYEPSRGTTMKMRLHYTYVNAPYKSYVTEQMGLNILERSMKNFKH